MIRARLLKFYLAGRFFTAIAGTFLFCAILIFMLDMVEILRQSGKYGNVPLRTMVWITVLRLPAFTEMLLGFAVQVGAIAALLLLNRKSELAIMRAGGMSVWQFLRPAMIIALVLGAFASLVYNPVAANARAESERLFAEVFGKESNFLQSQTGGSWLRQEGADGSSVVSAQAVLNKGLELVGVMFVEFDKSGAFMTRVDGERARLRDGFWQVENATVARVGEQAERMPNYIISTYLSPERVRDALGSSISVSFWELPGLIEATEKAGLTAHRFRIQYELLVTRPLLLLAMVLMGATVSLRSFRSGKIQSMVVYGMVGGFGFLLLAEVSRQVGVAGLVSPIVAVWVPILVAILLSCTILLHQEDG